MWFNTLNARFVGWNLAAPYVTQQGIGNCMAILQRTCAKVAFICGTTDIGLDNEMLCLRSRNVVLEAYLQINNPNKGMGVIRHSDVSNCTSLYCGGHVSSRKESTIDCVKILLLALSGALIESPNGGGAPPKVGVCGSIVNAPLALST